MRRNPLDQLKAFPWLALAQAAAIASAIDTLLAIAVIQIPAVKQVFSLLLSPPLGLLVLIALAVGIGAIAVYIMERLHRHILLNVGVLWALVLCVMLGLLLKSLLLPTIISADQTTLIGVILGVFWKGRAHWR